MVWFVLYLTVGIIVAFASCLNSKDDDPLGIGLCFIAMMLTWPLVFGGIMLGVIAWAIGSWMKKLMKKWVEAKK